MAEMKKEEEKLEKERKELAERFEAQNAKEKAKQEKIKAAQEAIRQEFIQKQQEEYEKRAKKNKPNKKSQDKIEEAENNEEIQENNNETLDSCDRLKNDVKRKGDGILQYVETLKVAHQEAIAKGTEALKKLEKIKSLIRNGYEEGVEKYYRSPIKLYGMQKGEISERTNLSSRSSTKSNIGKLPNLKQQSKFVEVESPLKALIAKYSGSLNKK